MSELEKDNELATISKLLQLESMARASSSKKELIFMIVNETRRLIAYRQVYFFMAKHPIRRDCELVAASSIAVIDEHTPFVEWLQKLQTSLFDSETINKQHLIDISKCPDEFKEGWNEYSLPYVLWSPLQLPDGTFIGGLWLTRETVFHENELLLLQRLGATYAHAIVAITSRRAVYKRPTGVRLAVWVILLFICLILLKPIQLTALAPAEITAIDPAVVSAPMNGVLSEIYFSPNTHVTKGEILFSLEDSDLQNEYNVIEKTLAVAEAELRKVSQDAFKDAKSKGDIALLKAEVELQKTKLLYARELLNKVNVKTDKTGILIYTDKSDWLGRPVKVGERIMEIADPSKIQLKINLPIKDAIVIENSAGIDVFLDADPLNPVSAKISNASYIAEKSSQDIMSYRLYGQFDNDVDVKKLRIGLQGTSKIYGERVSLFFYLFRRPISTIRQLVGI